MRREFIVTITVFLVISLGALTVAAQEPPTAWQAEGADLEGRAPGDDRVPPAAGDTYSEPVASAAPKVIYLSLEGITLSQGQDNSLQDVSAICGGSFPAYGDGQVREAMLQAVAEDWEPYNVQLTTERPTEGNYTMAVVSNVPQSTCGVNGSGIYGVAPMDCGDQANNIVFAFHDVNDGLSPLLHATVVSQEVAHSYGLDHVQNSNGIMNPSPTGGDQWFDTGCKPNLGSVFCSEQHAEFCPSEGLDQDSHAELLALIGPREADLVPPSVVIQSPSEGDTFEAGSSIGVVADATDEVSVAEVSLELDGVPLAMTAMEPPYAWTLTDLSSGSHVLVATAQDGAGNTASSEAVEIEVGSVGGSTSGGTGGSGDETSDTPGGESSDDGLGEGSGGVATGPTFPDAADDDDDEGCGCSEPTTGSRWAFLLPVFLMWRRRSAGPRPRVRWSG